jgi:excisionase family DNA binding protein
MKRHELLSGETIPLKDIEARDTAFLGNLQRMANDGMSFFELERVAIGPGSPALRGWSRVTPEIVGSPLYRVAADIVTRAGIAQGLLLAPEHEEKRSEVPADRSLMSVTQAANTLGISRAAVHKAIQQERLPSQRYGNVLLVDREAVRRYRQARSGRGSTPPSKRRGRARGEPDGGALVAKSR